MSYTSYFPDTDLPVRGTARSGSGVAVAGRSGALGGSGDTDMAVAGAAGEALGQVAAGLRGGAGVRELQAGIEAGQRMLGNRAFLDWVGALHSGGREAATPLQLMGKKRKKPGAGAPAPGPGGTPPLPATAGNGEAGSPCGTRGHAAAGAQRVREHPEIAPAKTELTPRESRLFDACITGNACLFRQFIRFGNVDVNMADKFGPFLCHAAYGGHTAITRELLSMRDVDVNLAQQAGATPLYLAAQRGHEKVVELLLAVPGTNVNLATKEGATPLHIAVQKGHAQIVRLLLAAHGINVNAEMHDNNTTALILALHLELKDIAELLLDASDIDIGKPLTNAMAPIHFAARNNLAGIVEKLVERGADVNLAIAGGLTPLYLAAEQGHLESARVLLRAPGIRVNQARGIRYVPLGVAAQSGHKEVVKLLLRKGADPNIRTATGLTPLHVVCLHGNMAIVQMLLHCGADTDAEVHDPEGTRQTQTPYSLAELGGHRGVMSVLAAHRRHSEAAPPLEQLPVTAEPGRTAKTLASPVAVSHPVIAAGAPVQPTSSSSPEAPESRPMEGQDMSAEATARAASASAMPDRPDTAGTGTQAAARTPLGQARDALRQEVLGKLRADNLEPLEGIRLLEDINATDSIDALCSLYNRLAHIERRKERARRAGKRREAVLLSVGPAPALAAAPVFTLAENAGLDAEGVEGEIKKHLHQRYHRFVSQAVNDMEFGRGKRTAGYPDLWHVSAGIPGVGSCSVFYYLDAVRNRDTGRGDRPPRGERVVPAGLCRQGVGRSGPGIAHCLRRWHPVADEQYGILSGAGACRGRTGAGRSRCCGVRADRRRRRGWFRRRRYGRCRQYRGSAAAAGYRHAGRCGQAGVSASHGGRTPQAGQPGPYAVGGIAGCGKPGGYRRAQGCMRPGPVWCGAPGGGPQPVATDGEEKAAAGGAGSTGAWGGSGFRRKDGRRRNDRSGRKDGRPERRDEAGQTGEAGQTEEAGMTEASGTAVDAGAGAKQVPEPGQKKKKKSRVQVALNTLRGEGTAAFGAYIEAEIGEAALLRTLVERIMRAEDLRSVRKEALGVVEGRLRLLDPLLPQGQAPRLPQGQAPRHPQGQAPRHPQGQAPLLDTAQPAPRASRGAGREEPEIAPVMARMGPNEWRLFAAYAVGTFGRFMFLLRNLKVDINAADHFGTLLVNAALDGRKKIVRELLSVRDIDVNLAQQQGATPLYLAAQEGHVEIVRMLLAVRGIKINLSKSDGATPLFVAAQLGRVKVVELLLAEPGTNVNAKTSVDEGTPLLVALQMDRWRRRSCCWRRRELTSMRAPRTVRQRSFLQPSTIFPRSSKSWSGAQRMSTWRCAAGKRPGYRGLQGACQDSQDVVAGAGN